jgi:hypothetical protein
MTFAKSATKVIKKTEYPSSEALFFEITD